MTVGDLIWGIIVAYILLAAVWLTVESYLRVRRIRRRPAKRSAAVVDLKAKREKRSA